MLKVGLTGGIASGKSVVAEAFSKLGVPVIDADEVAREVVNPGEPALGKLIDLLGSGIITEKSALNRKMLRQLIFSDANLRLQVEAILHPAILNRIADKLAVVDAPYALIVIPLLVESGLQTFVDRILVVECPEEIRVQRLIKRDGETPESAQRILAAQADSKSRLQIADDIIQNTGELADLTPKVLDMHNLYMRLADSLADCQAGQTRRK